MARDVLDRDETDPQATILAIAACTAALGFLCRAEEAQDLRERGRAVAAAHKSALPLAMPLIEFGACLAYLAAGRPGEAAAVAVTGYQDATEGEAVPVLVSGWVLCGGLAAAPRPANSITRPD